MFTYSMYLKEDRSNDQFNTARSNFGFEGQDCYVIYDNGRPNMIQSEGNTPYLAATLEESAQLHVDTLNAEVEPEE